MNPLIIVLGLFILALIVMNYASKWWCRTDPTKRANMCTDLMTFGACVVMVGSIVWFSRSRAR